MQPTMKPQYIYRVLDFENYDGDSVNCTLDLGFDLVIHIKSRVNGIDTPELRGGTILSKKAARLAKNAVYDWLTDKMKNGQCFFESNDYRGKFGRPLGDFVDIDESGILKSRLTKYLVDENLAVPYHGQAKSEVARAHEKNIGILFKKRKLDLTKEELDLYSRMLS